MLTVARVLKPQGLKGEIKTLALADGATDLLYIKTFNIEGREYAVERIKTDGVFAYIKLQGVDDRNTAETLRNKEIKAKRESLPPLDEGRYYLVDLIGLDVYVSSTCVGKIVDILQHGSADVYCVKGDKNFMFPAANGVILSTDISGGKIVLDGKKLEGMAVYED